MIETADILAPKAFEEDDDDVLPHSTLHTPHSTMNRTIDGFEFCFALVVAGIVIALLADGAEKREGRIQNQRCIVGTVDKLIGGADLDRAVVPESTAHTCPAEECCH